MRPEYEIKVKYNGIRHVQIWQGSTAGELALFIADLERIDPDRVILESSGNKLRSFESLANFRTKSVKVFILQDFVFQTVSGELTIRLRNTATLRDACEMISQCLGKRSDLICFKAGMNQQLDLMKPLASLGPLSISVLNPTKFSFNGHNYSLPVDSSIIMRDLKSKISSVVGGGISPEQFSLLFSNSEVDDDMTLEDLDYGPLSLPLIVETKSKPSAASSTVPSPALAKRELAPSPQILGQAPPPKRQIWNMESLSARERAKKSYPGDRQKPRHKFCELDARCPDELVLNVDEVGSQKWTDRKPRRVIIPHQERPQRIQCSVPRSQKRISCIAGISMAGDT
jgi:hypothetical protein